MKSTLVQSGFFGQDNLIGSPTNSPKEVVTTVNANTLTGITGRNDSVMLHLDPVKNIDADIFEEKSKENIKLAADSGFKIPALYTGNGAAHVKSIRRLCSSRRTNKHNKGKNCVYSLTKYVLNTMEKNYTLQCMAHLIKCIRNNACRKTTCCTFLNLN